MGARREPGVLAHSIRWQVSMASVVLTTLVVLSVGVVLERNARRALTEELISRLCVQADHLALTSAAAMLTPYPELTLHPYLLNMRERERELALGIVCDGSGTILGDADPRRLGKRFQLPEPVTRARASPMQGVSVAETSHLLLASAPVLHPNGRVLGTAYVALPRSHLDRAIARARGPALVVFAGLLLIGAAASFLLSSTLLKPMDALREGLERIGRGDLKTRLDLDRRSEFGRLAATVNRMTADLQLAQTQAIERERLAHEIALAQHIQRSLLPPESLSEGAFVISGRQRPAAEVGGDFYDVFRLADGRVGLAVADVAGKGLAGCLVTSMVAALLVALRDGCKTPSELLAALDHSLSRRLERGVFVTMFVAFLDPRTGILTYASAGHHPALLAHADGRQEWLTVEGMPLAVERGERRCAARPDRVIGLAPGDLVLQTTDGIHETEGGAASEAFGFDRVAAMVAAHAVQGAEAVLDGLSEAIERWRAGAAPQDDETLVALSWESLDVVLHDQPRWSPADRVAEARARGTALKLPATIEALVRLEDWVERVPGLAALPSAERARRVFVLHELLSNIVEHGFHEGPAAPIQVWWVPALEAGPPGAGHFVVLDQAPAFAADNIEVPDYGDPKVRRRGRGFGMDLVRRAGARLARHPGTALGNVLVVSFDGQRPWPLTEGEAA